MIARVRRAWTSRWLPAVFVAIALGAWPACNSRVADPAAGGLNLNFTLKDMNGAEVNLASLKGKPILVNMWATWCGPCKAETPWFVELSEKYRDKGLQVIGISVDDVPADIQKFAAEYGVNYPMLVGKDRADVSKTFDAENVLPVTWLVRADGTVHTKVTGIHSQEWFDTQIQQLF